MQCQCDPLRPTIDEVLQFLTKLYEDGLGYSAINTARSALSAVVILPDNKTVGCHPLVIRFLKGIFELRTPQPRYNETWDVDKVLQFFRNMGENSEHSLKDLTLKLCSLLLLITAHRVQTIHLIRLRNICFHDDGCTIYITEKLKQSRPGFHPKPLQLPFYTEDKTLCVVTCLRQYINSTVEFRCESDETDQLLLCYQQPHGPAAKDTIARWLKTVLIRAGITNFAPHSFRGASSSAMFKSGVAVQDILKVAGWSNVSTFKKFYNKPLESKDKSNTILNYYAKVGK